MSFSRGDQMILASRRGVNRAAIAFIGIPWFVFGLGLGYVIWT